MGGIAEFERGLIRKRTDEGIERAKRQGKILAGPRGWMLVGGGLLPTVTARGQQS
jgi:DNA invertase Pin-like site-specific DNA recombinase